MIISESYIIIVGMPSLIVIIFSWTSLSKGGLVHCEVRSHEIPDHNTGDLPLPFMCLIFDVS